jgi:hypothetical protein
MTDGGATFQPGPEEVAVPFRARSAYVGYKAFGSGDGAVLVKPKVTHQLRSAAEFATQERRVTGGLLYGRAWLDDQGAYLVVDGFLEAGPGENSGDRLRDDGPDEFKLSDADLRLLREDAARMYAASLEVGWWRTLGALGDFGPLDFETQARLVGPDGVGLLVYGSGIHWGTAYLGPDGLAPDSAGTLVAAPAAEAGEVFEAAGASVARAPAPPAAPEPEAADSSAGGDRPVPPRTRRRAEPGTGRTRQWVTSRVRVPPRTRTWAGRPASPGYPGPETPADVQIVVIALAVAVVAAAIIIGVLVSNAIVAIVIAVVGLLAIFSTVWMSRR